MSSRRGSPLGWAAALFLLLSLGWAGWAFNQRRLVQAEADELARTQLLLDSSIQRAQVTLNEARRARPASKPSAPAAAQAAKPNARPDYDAIISTHPDLLATYVKAVHGYLDQTYGAIFARLQLSRDQIDRLETLITNDMENQMDLNAAAQSQGLSRDDPMIAKEREQQIADLQNAEQDVLGQQAYQAFDSVSRAEAVRGTAEQVASMTTSSANPLTGEQTQQLVQLMAQSSSDYRNGQKATAATVDWDAVLAQAPTFLAPTQVATLRGVAQLTRFQGLVKQYAAQQAAAKP